MYKSSQVSSKIITSRETVDKSERKSMLQDRLQHSQTKMLSLLVSRLAISRLAHAFERVRLLPLREEIMRKRIKRVIENLFKRHDYLAKWEAFQNIRRTALASEKTEQERLKGILKKQRGTVIRLLTHFMLGKKRDILLTTIQRLRERGEVNQQKCNKDLRKGIRAMARIVTRKMSNSFFKVKDSRVIIGQNKRLRNVVMIMKEIRTQNMRWAFALIRREMVRDRQEKVEEEIQ